MKKILFFTLVLTLLIITQIHSQEVKTARAVRIDKAPVIDGKLEDLWLKLEPHTGFVQYSPRFGEPSPVKTEVFIAYDNNCIYFAFKCYDPETDKISKAVTTRDGGITGDDSVMVLLDTFHDRSSAYTFSTNILGTQMDGRYTDNGRSKDYKWDTKWQSAGTLTEYGWSAELAIPLESIKYITGEDVTWGVDFLRYIPRRRESATWAGKRETLSRADGFGELKGLTLGTKEIKRLELIPHMLLSGGENQDVKSEFGIDARYRISDKLSADFTVNPDFALVEADVEQINLSRFEQYISEKRPFFLEGAEMFEQRMEQFYSRRIGDISWGGKMTGKAAGFDVSFIAAQSQLDKNQDNEDPVYTVARAKRTIFGSSNIGVLLANRNLDGENTGSVGLDTTLFFNDTMGMTAQFIRAHGPENDGKIAWFVRPSYDSANSHFHVRYTHIDEDMKENMNAVGYFRDDNRKELDTNISHEEWVNSHGIDKIEADVNYNRYWGQNDQLRSWSLDVDFEVKLTNRFELEFCREDELEVYEKDFRNDETSIGIGYDNRQGMEISFSFGDGTNEEMPYTITGAETELKLTDAWNVSYRLSWLNFDPDPEEESTWIHVIRSNYYLNKDLYLKLFYQSNSVIDKNNIQALVVWRFMPPFGSFQLAFQRGTSRFGQSSEQGNTFYSKLAWVF